MGECVLSVSDQAALCPPGFRDEIRQILKYTTYRAISESDDAKGQNRSLSIIDSSASKSRSSSSSSGSGSLIVRSCGNTTEIQKLQQAITFQIQKAMDNILTEFGLMEQAMHLQIESPGHPFFYFWHDAIITVRLQFVSCFQKKKFKTWKALVQELEQKGWSTKQDIQCVTQMHNEVTQWVLQLDSESESSNLRRSQLNNLCYRCTCSIARLTHSPDMVSEIIINISPFEEIKLQMRDIFWAMVEICKKSDDNKLEDVVLNCLSEWVVGLIVTCTDVPARELMCHTISQCLRWLMFPAWTDVTVDIAAMALSSPSLNYCRLNSKSVAGQSSHRL